MVKMFMRQPSTWKKNYQFFNIFVNFQTPRKIITTKGLIYINFFSCSLNDQKFEWKSWVSGNINGKEQGHILIPNQKICYISNKNQIYFSRICPCLNIFPVSNINQKIL